MPKIIDAPHKIIQLNVLATGQLILTTENRVYAQKDGVWHAMEFAPDPVDPPPAEPESTGPWDSGRFPGAESMSKRLTTVAAVVLAGYVTAALAQTNLGPNVTTVSAGATATMAALAANPSRRAVTICNGHASNTVTFTTGTTTPVSVTTGVTLLGGNVASSCFTIGSPANQGSGNVGAQINVIASSVSTPVAFIEYN